MGKNDSQLTIFFTLSGSTSVDDIDTWCCEFDKSEIIIICGGIVIWVHQEAGDTDKVAAVVG